MNMTAVLVLLVCLCSCARALLSPRHHSLNPLRSSAKLDGYGYGNHDRYRYVSSQCCGNLKRSVTFLHAIVGPVRYSSEDWLLCIKSLPSSRILERTKYSIGFFTLWTAVVTLLFKAQSWPCRFILPSSVHSVLGSALGLLLVFRTNTSYDRFWEGRKAQSAIILACRNIATHTYVHIPKEYHSPIAAILAAFVLLQKQHLQGIIDQTELDPLAPFLQIQQRSNSSVKTDLWSDLPKILTIVGSKRNRPLYILRVLEQLIHEALAAKYADTNPATATHASTTPKYIEKHFIECLSSLGTQLAACERIVKQPVPLSYSRHTSRFLSLYLLTLPFSLVGGLGWLTVPTVAAICWSFISIQEIGHFIEEPFDKKKQIIPLNQIASVVRSDISELLEGALSSPELDRMDSQLLREMRENSRNEDEANFAYYTPPLV